MSTDGLPPMQTLEGRHINVALRDGSRIDDCQLVSASRAGAQTVWLFVDGLDVFLPVAAITACWEAAPPAGQRPHRGAHGVVDDPLGLRASGFGLRASGFGRRPWSGPGP